MELIGAVHYLGVALALARYASQRWPRYRAILFDEMLDIGTLELSLIRRLVAPAENDLFLCGDTAQSVTVKHHRPKDARIEFRRQLRMLRNYRNSREILDFASRAAGSAR